MKLRITLIFCILSSLTFAKGINGSYLIQGVAYNHMGEALRNVVLIVNINGTKTFVKTDSLGYYHFDVRYETVCPSVVSVWRRCNVNNEINGDIIMVEYDGAMYFFKNKWRRYMKKGVYRKNIKFYK